MWNNDDGKDLEAIGGGFNVTLEALQDKQHRSKIATKLREFTEVTDEIVRVLIQGIEKCGNVEAFWSNFFEKGVVMIWKRVVLSLESLYWMITRILQN